MNKKKWREKMKLFSKNSLLAVLTVLSMSSSLIGQEYYQSFAA